MSDPHPAVPTPSGASFAAGSAPTADLLAVYDQYLRTDAEMVGASTVQRFGPVLVGRFSDDDGLHGFVTHPDLAPADAAQVRALVREVVEALVADPEVAMFEWKTRGHDRAPGLVDALAEAGLTRLEPETVMLGPVDGLLADRAAPDGVQVRRAESFEDLLAMEVLQSRTLRSDTASPETDAHLRVQRLLEEVAQDSAEFWVAEADGQVVSTGILRPVPGTEVAGLWGGVTHPDWRGRGIYRALTAARARSAATRGLRFLHSDSTEFSRPILQRSGLHAITTTTPWEWHRPHQ